MKHIHYGLKPFLLIFQREGYYLVRNQWTVLAISGETTATKEGVNSLDYFRARNTFLRWILRVNLTMDSSTAIVMLKLGERVLVLL